MKPKHGRGRRPVSRQLMVALFVMMVVPMLGWLVVVETPARATTDIAVEEVRGRLVVVLVASLAVFGGLVFWLRRNFIEPVQALAETARVVRTRAWRTPEAVDREDEIGDLAVALDRAVRSLERRADEAATLASDLSHELRTPLAAIRGAAELLCDDDPEPDDASRFHRNILTQARRLERLVAGLLEMEQVRQGQRPTRREHERVDISSWIESITSLLGPLVERKRLQLEIQLDAQHASFESERAERVLFSLLENAVRFSPEAKTIQLEVESDEGRITFRVRDQGTGVPSKLVSRVFERRVSAESRSGRGTGLGLAIARNLVEAGEGGIELTESGPSGACFAFWLPAETDPDGLAPTPG